MATTGHRSLGSLGRHHLLRLVTALTDTLDGPLEDLGPASDWPPMLTAVSLPLAVSLRRQLLAELLADVELFDPPGNSTGLAGADDDGQPGRD